MASGEWNLRLSDERETVPVEASEEALREAQRVCAALRTPVAAMSYALRGDVRDEP